jgi:hypothetical protein
MATTIKLKNGSGAPLAGDLVQGEPALDLTNKRLYTEDSGGTVIEVGTNPSTIDINAGTIDGTVIGGSSAAAGTFTTFTSTGIDDNATSTAITIDSSENVGIGTASPSQKMHINVPSGPVFLQVSSGSSDGFFGYDSDSGNQTLQSDTGLHFTTGASFTERMRIDASGNVGIGTTSPSELLHIAESTGTSTLRSQNDSGSFYFGIDNSTGGTFSTGNYSRVVYSGGAYPMVFATNNAERMRIDSSGNVGIGTASPGYPLDVVGSMRIRHADSDDFATIIGPSNRTLRIDIDANGDTDSFVVRDLRDGSERFRVQADGNVGIGTSSPSTPLAVTATTTGAILTLDKTTTATNSVEGVLSIFTRTSGTAAAGLGSRINFITENSNGTVYETAYIDAFTSNSGAAQKDGVLAFSTASGVTNPTERMRIDSSGNLLVGTTDNTPYNNGTSTSADKGICLGNGFISTANYNASAADFNRTGTDGNIVNFYKNGATKGNISITSSAVAYNTTSDERLKENIVDAPAGNIDAIRVRSFDWKADGTHQTYGMVAQELVDVAPEAVSQGDTEDDMWGVDYSKLVPMMIKEIQDLRARVAQLEGA